MLAPLIPATELEPTSLNTLLDKRYLKLADRRVSTIYSSDGSVVTVGNNSATRSTMLPPDSLGDANIQVAANQMAVGSYLDVEGEGRVSAAAAAAGNYNVIPWVTPAGGSKTDLGGANAIGVTLGVVAYCFFRARFLQTASGVLISGFIFYAQQNMGPLLFTLNTARTISASDPTVARVFGVDGKWDSAQTANFQESWSVIAKLWRRLD